MILCKLPHAMNEKGYESIYNNKLTYVINDYLKYNGYIFNYDLTRPYDYKYTKENIIGIIEKAYGNSDNEVCLNVTITNNNYIALESLGLQHFFCWPRFELEKINENIINIKSILGLELIM